MNKKAICICSGGLDSTVAFYYMEKVMKYRELIPLNFSYGSKHNKREREAARLIFGDRLVEIDIDLSFLNSSLLNNEQAIPNGHYEDKSMMSTVVPFRNGIMLSYATAMAEDLKINTVVYGSHFGDHAIYPDCRQSFSDMFSKAMTEGTYNKVMLFPPFVEIRKDQIVELGKKMDIESIMSKTYSCYNGKEKHCGKCGTCIERKEAFNLAGVKDLTEYKGDRNV